MMFGVWCQVGLCLEPLRLSKLALTKTTTFEMHLEHRQTQLSVPKHAEEGWKWSWATFKSSPCRIVTRPQEPTFDPGHWNLVAWLVGCLVTPRLVSFCKVACRVPRGGDCMDLSANWDRDFVAVPDMRTGSWSTHGMRVSSQDVGMEKNRGCFHPQA